MQYPGYKLPAWYKPDYHYLEDQIAKLERRIKRIEENPDPSKLASNKLIYVQGLAGLKDRLEAWKQGKPFVYSMIYEQALGLMGLRCINLSAEADRNALNAPDFFKAGRAAGFPDSVCDRFQVAAGMWRAGALPPPSFVCGAGVSCNIEMEMMVAAAHDFPGCPNYFIDRWVESDGGEPLDYLVAQLREMMKAAKDAIPEAKEFTEETLQEVLESEEEGRKYGNVLYEAAKTVPCPIRGQDMFRIPLKSGTPEQTAVEVSERVKRRYSAVGEEKARCMWLVSGPFIEDAMTVLESRGVSVPIFQWDSLPGHYGYGEGRLGDRTEYGRKLSPLEEFARLMHVNYWSGPVHRWVDEVMEHIKEFKIDMLVYYVLSGCPTNSLAGRIIAETAEREFGVPTLLIEGYMMDRERYQKEEIHARLNELVDTVFARKGIK